MAQGDILIEIDGVQGDSQDKKHPNTIELSSYAFSVNNDGSRHTGDKGGGKGQAHFTDINCTAPVGKHSPRLISCCAGGDHITKATLYVRKQSGADGGQVDYLIIKLDSVLISSFQQAGSAHGDSTPQESFSINFAKINVDYAPQGEKGALAGKVSAGWNIPERAKA
jgi:type VI secretion system secreted protein Hcp